MSDFNFVKEKKNTSFFPALECGITYSGNSLNGHRLLRTPAYNGQFHFSRRKAHKFSQIFALYGYQLIQSTDIFLCPESQTQVFFFYQASTRNDIWGINNGGSFLKIYSKIYNLKQWNEMRSNSISKPSENFRTLYWCEQWRHSNKVPNSVSS